MPVAAKAGNKAMKRGCRGSDSHQGRDGKGGMLCPVFTHVSDLRGYLDL
jgi:hypothetical protein